jgi:hypothetical protein
MRIEPEHGQDIPTEASSVVIQQGAARYRFIDRGDHLEVMLLSSGRGIPGLLVHGQSGNVIHIAPGTVP